QFTSKTELIKLGKIDQTQEIKGGVGKGTLIFNRTKGHVKSINFSVKLTLLERNRDRSMTLEYIFGARHKKPDSKEEK
ncbi:MAG: hypothetical protein P1V97_13375, partial [Planctomycetota bacterium]|nr:hypothetical protein [Planctomycetota bacterium]